jgi:hypothetical protein
MSTTHEVISAFLDDEPFDPRELMDALSDPSGRGLLIDLVALRHIVQPDEVMPRTSAPRTWRSSVRVTMAAAAVVVALVGGYFVGESRSTAGVSEPPAPTRIVQGPATWRVVPEGGIR